MKPDQRVIQVKETRGIAIINLACGHVIRRHVQRFGYQWHGWQIKDKALPCPQCNGYKP